MLKYVAVIAFALVLSVSGALGLARPDAPARATVAGSAADPAALRAGASQDLTGTVATLQQRLRDLPADDPSWATLGLAYVEQARVGGDAAFYTKADEAIARSFALRPDDNSSALAARAALEAARHDFSGALADADAALAVDPLQSGALAVRIDALTELGRYDEQLTALRVADRRQPGVPVAARYSYAYELRGRLARASRVLETAATSASHADRGFLLTLVSDLERRRGRLDAAGRTLRQALLESPGYLPALVGRARLEVAAGDLDTAVATWRDVVHRLPLPEYVTELGELSLHRGDPAEAERQFSVVDATVRLLAAGGVDTDLETALFEADHGSPEAALSSARAEWAKRRSVHVADALAWALHVNGHDQAALRMTRTATRLGTQEARMWLHRGLIEHAVGLDGPAARHLRRGIALDPGASPWQVDRARTALAGIEARR